MNPSRSVLFDEILLELSVASPSNGGYVNLCLAFFTQYPIG